ncbi:MAG: hydroxymethylbilane synthase, partial [Methanomicrobiales archaeon]|nr:hydroxymethylbilane synthase [Methanomicrobiales archaeon]
IGTSSTRRKAQLLRHDPSINIKPLRGNLDTRIRRLVEGDFDAVVVAEAGLQRLGYRVTGQRLPPRQFVPTANQGTIAVVCRKDPALLQTLVPLDHQPTRKDVLLERGVMEEVGGGCFTPMGIFCQGGHLTAEILSLDGTRRERLERDLTTEADARQVGRDLRVRGAELIEQAYVRLGRGNER